MDEWPEYETRKRVRAAKIVGTIGDTAALDPRQHKELLLVEPEPGVQEAFEPTEPAMMGRVGVGDYALRYPDGFKSVNTKANFEATAVLVSDEPAPPAKPDHVWAAVLNSNVRVDGDTLKAEVTTHVRAFTSEGLARFWANNQAETWSIVKTELDPDIKVAA